MLFLQKETTLCVFEVLSFKFSRLLHGLPYWTQISVYLYSRMLKIQASLRHSCGSRAILAHADNKSRSRHIIKIASVNKNTLPVMDPALSKTSMSHVPLEDKTSGN